jgi:hypothetical protein
MAREQKLSHAQHLGSVGCICEETGAGIRRKAPNAIELSPNFLLTLLCLLNPYIRISHFFRVREVPWTTFLLETLFRVLESFL